MDKRTNVLCILDGFGYREELENNAITPQTAPFYFSLLKEYPFALLRTDGERVGLPDGQMGNSEVGHMNIGAGRVVYQDLPMINQSIRKKEFDKSSQLIKFISTLKQSGGVCHLTGLASPGGVHSHEDHILVLAETVSRSGVEVVVHLLLDGRDTPPQDAIHTIPKLVEKLSGFSNVKVASLCGRYYAMDRDKRWDRIERAYQLFTKGEGQAFVDSSVALKSNYDQGINDEFVVPCILPAFKPMKDGDGLLVANFRADRVRQILSAFLLPDFNGFKREKIIKFSSALGMVNYSDELSPYVQAIFPPKEINNSLGEVLASHHKTQLRIAETEKYAHVTYFFNGGCETIFEGEERILIPSPKVATYDLKPEMSAFEVTDKLVEAIHSKQFDFIVVNYANGDMVGHSGVLDAACKAVQALDICLKRVVDSVKEINGVLLITADHGNCEEMFDEKMQVAYTSHTLNPVPAILINEKTGKTLKDGKLADIAPTFLELMGIEKPKEMTGESLLKQP